MAVSVISLLKESPCVELRSKTMKHDLIEIWSFSVCEAWSRANRWKTLHRARNCCGCTEIWGIKNTPFPLRFRRVSLQWGNNTSSLPCVMWPFHLLYINQMWLDSLHKFPWRVTTLISSLWKRSVVVGWFMKQVLLVKYLGKSASTLWQTFAMGGLPLLGGSW